MFKEYGQGINVLISNNKKSRKSITNLKDPSTNKLAYKRNEVANVLNKHLATIGQKLSSNIPDSNTQFTEFLRDINVNESFFFNPVNPEEVELEILQTPSNKSFGLYSFPINILKSSRCILSSPLATISNTSIVVEPSQKLKTSKITPIFKAGEDNDPNSYRPISILSVFNRIFEKLMYNRLIQFTEHNKLLNNEEYGFRTGHSTTHAVLDIVNTIPNNMDNRLFSCAVFIDLQKAFDSVNHSILIKKLDYLGVRGCINSWFESYLSGRKQTTEIDAYIYSQKEGD